MVRFKLLLGCLILFVIVSSGMAGCNGRAEPIPGLYGIPLETPTPLPTVTPTPVPPLATAIVITPQSGKADPEATFIINVIVEDEYGWLQEAMLTLTWPDGAHAPMTIGPTADIKLPIQASMSPFTLTVEKQGYMPVHQPFVVAVSEDSQFEFIAVLVKRNLAA